MFFNFSFFTSKEDKGKKKLLFADVNELETKPVEPIAEPTAEHSPSGTPSGRWTWIPMGALKFFVESERTPYIGLTAISLEILGSLVAFGFGFCWIGTARGQANVAKLQDRAHAYIRMNTVLVGGKMITPQFRKHPLKCLSMKVANRVAEPPALPGLLTNFYSKLTIQKMLFGSFCMYIHGWLFWPYVFMAYLISDGEWMKQWYIFKLPILCRAYPLCQESRHIHVYMYYLNQ